MNRSLGQIMITENLLTAEQVEEAVNFKNENRCHFGAACVAVSYPHLTMPTICSV